MPKAWKIPVCLGVSLTGAALAQKAGTLAQEEHPAMTVEQCYAGGSCSQEQASIVMDSNWRWVHKANGYNNCLNNDTWDKELCPDPETCAENCVVEGNPHDSYVKDYKVSTAGSSLTLEFPNGPRVYMMEGEDKYKMFHLLNSEFTFDIDLSTLPCGANGALYFIEMAADGGPGGPGAKYGAGYCDAQCPHSKWLDGKANLEEWKTHKAKNPDLEWVEVGPEGKYGTCCAEMDILEANREAGTFTAHPCDAVGAKTCEGDEECGDKEKGLTGTCDKDGCGFASYRAGDKSFWGVGSDFQVDTSKPMTVVTQFITSDNTATGDLVEIRRVYVQDGKVIENSEASLVPGGGDSLTDSLCDASNEVFNASSNGFKELGGLKAMGKALQRGMVLSMSIWADDFGRMLWMDGEKGAADEDKEDPGVVRGPCPFDVGTSKDLKAHIKEHGKMEVIFSNIKYGPIGSTFHHDASQTQRKFKVFGAEPERTRAAEAAPWRLAPAALLVGAAAAAALGLLVARLPSLADRLRGAGDDTRSPILTDMLEGQTAVE